jgi:hypothetical protein
MEFYPIFFYYFLSAFFSVYKRYGIGDNSAFCADSISGFFDR